jgi:hypothetical protein
LRNRVRRAKQQKQRNVVGPKQRGAGGRVREGREPRVGEPVGSEIARCVHQHVRSVTSWALIYFFLLKKMRIHATTRTRGSLVANWH